MSAKAKKLKENNHKVNVYNLAASILIISIAIIPLLVRVMYVEYPMSDYSWYTSQNEFFDVFSKVKANAIILMGALALAPLFYHIKYIETDKRIIKPNYFYPLAYGILIVLSTLFSEVPYASIHGFIERYEGIWVLLSYLTIFALCASIKWPEKSLKKLLLAFWISNIILSIIGIFQYLGIDLIVNEFTKPFITSTALKGFEFDLNKSFNYTAIFQTLYHSNYVGLYTSLSFPVFATLSLYEKSKALRLGYMLTSIAIIFNLIGSISRGGIIGIAIGIPFFIILNHQIILKNKKTFSIIALLLLVTAFGFETYTNGFMMSRFKQIFSSTQSTSPLKEIKVNEDEIIIDYMNSEFKIKILQSLGAHWRMEYTLDDIKISPAGLNSQGREYFETETLKGFQIFLAQHNSNIDLIVLIDNNPWMFGYSNGKLMFKNLFGNYTAIEAPKTFGFEDKERLGSSRGYIWSRSIPLVLNKPFLGYGPDNFVFAFPQNDYVGKYRAYGTTNMVVDKPHNLFLQIAISTGILSLLLFLWVVLLALKRNFTIFIRQIKSHASEHSYSYILNNAFTISIISFLGASFFNDSNVNVSIVFWIILGLTISISSSELEKDNG